MLRLRSVTRSFGGEKILDGIDLSLARGEVWGLVGPAASGKSVLLKTLCGLLRPDSGEVLLDGEDLATATDARLTAARARFGMLFQNNALFDFMTIGENVAFPLARRGGTSPDALAAAVADRLREVGLDGTGSRMPGELSGGMRKRAGIARAIIARPDVVIYDEPTAGLDPVTTSKIYDLLRRERDQTGATTIVVSSDVDALLAFVPRVAMIHRGRLRFDGPAAAARDADDPIVRQFVRGDIEGPL